MATVRFTEDDRDSRGFIRLSPPTEDTTPAAEPSAAPPPMRRAAPVPAPRVPMPRGLVVLVSGGLIGLALIAMTIRFGTVPSRIVPRPPIATATTQLSTSVPSAAPATAALPVVMLPAYAAPDGAQLGMIESTRSITPTAHYGSDWIQADVQGSGVIWLMASDWPNLAIVGSDLAPRRPAAAPARAPIVPTAEPPPAATPACLTDADVRYTSERDVIYQGLPIGHVTGKSCYSQAEAEQNADAWEQAEITIYLAKPTSTPLPSATPMPLSHTVPQANGATP